MLHLPHVLQLIVPFLVFGSVFGDIKDLVRSLRDGVGRVVTWIEDTAWNAFESIATNVWNAATHVAGTVWDGATHLAGVFWDAAQNVREVLWSAATHVAGVFWDAAQNAREGIWSAATHVAGKAWDAAQNVREGIWSAATHVGGKVWDGAQNVREGAWSAATHVAGGIWDAAQNAREGIWSAATHVAGKVWDAAQNVREGIWDSAAAIVGGLKHVGDAVDTVGEKAISATLDHKEEVLAGLIFGPLGLATDELIRQHPDALKFLTDKGKWGLEKADSVLGEGFDKLLELFTGFGEVDESDAPTLAANFILLAGGLGFLAHLAAVPGDAAPTLSNHAKSNLAGFLGKFSGWEPAIAATLGATAALGVKRPMEQHINKRTRTNIPDERVLDNLFSRRWINEDDYTEIHRRHGFTDIWSDHLKNAAYRPARVFELARIMQFVDVPDDVLQRALEDAGYRDELIVDLKVALHNVAKKTSSSKLLASATSAYSDGFIDDADFGRMCAAAGIAPDEQQLLLFVAQVDYQVKVKGELLSAYRSRATADALTDEELRAGLAGIGITGAKADVEVARAHIARLKKPVDDTAVAHRKAVNETRATLTSAYKLQFKKGAISGQQLQDQLVYIGIPDFQARAIVELTKAEMLKAPAPARGSTPAEVAARVQKDLEDAYVTQYRSDAIDAQQLGAQLLAIGVDQAEAVAIVERERVKKVPKAEAIQRRTQDAVAKQVQAALAKAYDEQYKKGYISADELEQDLVAVGFDPAVARARRLEAEAAHAPKAPPLAG